MHFENLLVESSEAVATVRINRPERLNALNRATLVELDQFFAHAEQDSGIRAIILTGAGNKAFAAGADITEFNQLGASQARQFSALGQRLMNRVHHLEKPVIALINGYALGGGLELALACHLRVAAESARLGLPEIKLGVLPGFGGTQRLGRLAGSAIALELALTGEPIAAARAAALGIVNRCVPDDRLHEQGLELATRLANSAPEAVRGILQAVQLGMQGSLESGLALETARFAICCATEDMREGTAAFLEKRPARFTGN